MDFVAHTLANLYYNPDSPAAFSGIAKLYQEAKKEIPTISLQTVDEWLRKQITYRTHRFRRRRFKRLPVLAYHVDSIWQCDIMQLLDWAKENAIGGKPIKFLLIMIDTLSRFLMVEPMPTKTSRDVRDAFLRAFQKSGRYPQQIETDPGKEFLGKEVKNMFKELKIIHRVRPTRYKVAIAERVIQTLRNKIFKYITATKNNRFIDALQSFVDGYNYSVHRMLKMRPIDVTNVTERQAFENLYGNILKKGINESRRFQVGDLVNIFIMKHHLEKGTEATFDTSTIYEIESIDESRPPRITYRVRDFYTKEIMPQSFYAEELIRLPDETVANLPLEAPIRQKKKKQKRGPGIKKIKN